MLIRGAIKIFAVLIVVFIVFLNLTVSIPAGYAGVQYNTSGGVEKETLAQGWHIVSPMVHVTKYPVSTENVYYTNTDHEGRKGVDDSFNVTTKDGKPVKVNYNLAYHFDKEYLPVIFTNFKGNNADYIEYNFMRNEVGNVINVLASNYSTSDIFGQKRNDFAEHIARDITKRLADQGMIVESHNLSRIDPDAQTLQAIQAVVDAQQKMQQADLENQRAVIEAKKQITVAQGIADAQRITADAQAYSNQKLQQTITADIVSLKWIEKWDGKQSQTVLGSQQGMMINLGK